MKKVAGSSLGKTMEKIGVSVEFLPVDRQIRFPGHGKLGKKLERPQ